MKINPNKINPIYPSQNKQTNPIRGNKIGENTDRIEVSAQAKQELSISKIKSELVGTLVEETSQKVSKLKALINSGQYQVKHREVAEAILAYSEILKGGKDE